MTDLGKNEMKPKAGMPWSVRLSEGLGRGITPPHSPDSVVLSMPLKIRQARRRCPEIATAQADSRRLGADMHGAQDCNADVDL